MQETTVAEEAVVPQEELLPNDGDDAQNPPPKIHPKGEAAHEQLLGYLALIDPEFPTTEDEETGEQQVQRLHALHASLYNLSKQQVLYFHCD